MPHQDAAVYRATVTDRCDRLGGNGIAKEADDVHRHVLRGKRRRQRQERVAGAHAVHHLTGQSRHLVELAARFVRKTATLAAGDGDAWTIHLDGDVAEHVLDVAGAIARLEADLVFSYADVVRARI